MLYADAVVVRINLLLLMAVAFLPFPTALVAEAIDTTHAERAAVLFYGATLFVAPALFTSMGATWPAEELRRGGVGSSRRSGARRPPASASTADPLLAAPRPAAPAFGFLAIALPSCAPPRPRSAHLTPGQPVQLVDVSILTGRRGR